MKKNEEESLNKIISQYKNNKIENLYKNKKDFYPFNYEEKKPNKIPHEKLRKNSKKRVLNNFMNAMIFPFEEQRYLIDNNRIIIIIIILIIIKLKEIILLEKL